jgi:hypothetical protein
MSGIPVAALRELRGPIADELAEADREESGQGAVRADVAAPPAAAAGAADPALVDAAARSRASPRKEIDRDLMSVHGRRIDDLCRWGWTYLQIGKRVGCNVSALSRMRSNPAYEPHYWLGLALTRLWLDVARARIAMRRSKA